jgi:long-chain acyl-CoA synthetase
VQWQPWFAQYPRDVPRTLVPYRDVSAYAMLDGAARRHPTRPAVAWFGRHIAYRELLDEVERFSAVLGLLGVRRGDRVAMILPNSPQYVIAYWAALRIGAVAVGNNPLLTERELLHQLNDSGAEVVVVLDQLYPSLAAIRHEAACVRQVVVTRLAEYMKFPLDVLAPIKLRKEAKRDGKPWPPVPAGVPVLWWCKLMAAAGPPPPAVEVDAVADPAALLYTGGTTGLPKGVVLTHRNVTANAMQTAAWFADLRDGEDAIMCVLPFFHSYGMTVEMNVGILRAAKLILVPRFELHMALKVLEKEKATIFPGVPRLYVAINEAKETEKCDFRSLKACLSGAASLPQAVAERFEALTGARLREGYGLTEASPVTHANPIYGKAKPGSIGLPLPDTDCKIVDLDDPHKELGAGKRGELCVRGPQVMAGYWNRPEATALTIRDGWLHTGDVAEMDDEGYFSVVDRIKDIIIVSGFNVYPSEVEEVLYRHPKVLKAGVAGVPDDTTGEAVKAFVVLKPGKAATTEELIAWCRDPKRGVAAYRAPTQVEFCDALPETLIGKVLRRVLQENEELRRAAGIDVSTDASRSLRER